MRRTLAGLRVVVTGASQGIGRALVVEAARRGCRVIAAARSADLLADLEGESVRAVVADVTDPAGRQAMRDAAVRHFGGLDVLVNNAGIGATGHFMDSDPETLRRIFETNYFGPCELIRLCLPDLKRGTTPAVVQISSVLGRRAWPARSLYSASKFAVQGFSEAIRAELEKDGVDVLVVSPGLTATNFSKNLLENTAKLSMEHQRGMTPEQVATATWDAVARGTPDTTLTFRGKLLVLVTRFAPWVIDIGARRKVRKLFAGEIAERQERRAAQRQTT